MCLGLCLVFVHEPHSDAYTCVSSLSLFINSVLMSSTRRIFDFWKCVAQLEDCSPLPSQTLLKSLILDRRISFSAPAAARDDSNASTFCVNFATSLFCMQTNCQRMVECVAEAYLKQSSTKEYKKWSSTAYLNRKIRLQLLYLQPPPAGITC